MRPADEQPLPYRDRGSAAKTAANWWQVSSWGAFAAVLLIVIGGMAWLYQRAQTGEGEVAAIMYPFTIFLVGLASLAGLAVTLLAALCSRRREVAKAALPWALASASCGSVFLLYWLSSWL